MLYHLKSSQLQVYTESMVDKIKCIDVHFIDTYIIELSTTQGLVCSRQDNSDTLNSV